MPEFDFSTKNCPPSRAKKVNAFTCYRLVKNSPAKISDFKTHVEMFPKIKWGDGECGAHAMSVLTSIETAEEYQKIPRLKNTKIAKLKIDETHGLVDIESNGHCNWWPFSGVQRLSTFESMVL